MIASPIGSSSPGRRPGSRRRRPWHGQPTPPPTSSSPTPPTSTRDPSQCCTARTLPVDQTRTWMGSRGSPCMRTMGSTPPLPMGSTRGSKTRHDGLLPVSPANGFTGNSLKADPGEHRPQLLLLAIQSKERIIRVGIHQNRMTLPPSPSGLGLHHLQGLLKEKRLRVKLTNL